MDIDLPGRIKNISLPFSKGLFPLFEAVTNSIHAIQELHRDDQGVIGIFVERESQGTIRPEDYELRPIRSFKVEDNGIGFDEKNFKAFLTADTTSKANMGGKGIGRFVWLKAFGRVHIDSLFFESEKFQHRVFDFVASPNGIENLQLEGSGKKDHRTSVHLLEFDQEYQAFCPKKTDVIAMRIVQHALFYFLTSACPQIVLHDEGRSVNLNEMFSERIKRFTGTGSLRIKSRDFSITHLHMYLADENRHQIHYCADNREVKKENIATYIPDLSKRLKDDEGNSFAYSSYVSVAFGV